MSRTAAAKQLGVIAASIVRWMHTYPSTGRTQAKPYGGDRRPRRIEAQADFVMNTARQTPNIVLAELKQRLLSERGVYALDAQRPRRPAWGFSAFQKREKLT